jgi:hypothetical protein
MQMWLMVALAATKLVAVASIQLKDREQAVVAQAITDEVALRPQSGTVSVYHELQATTAHETDFDAWLTALLPEQYRARLSPAFFRSYWMANKSARGLPRPLEVGVSVRQVKRVDEEHLPTTGGIYSVSRVGFTAKGDSALVSVSFACRGLCGSDQLYLYVLLDGRWTQRLLLRSLVR